MEGVLPALIVGLGNPGPEYEETRHNAGFMVVDAFLAQLARSTSGPGVTRFAGRLYAVQFAGRRLNLLKPQTFVNESGRALAAARRGLGLVPAEILVVCDCMDLPVGRIRIRPGGGSGGHRGLESIIAALGTDRFPRLRVGIGRPRPGSEVVDYVLSRWAPAERSVIDRVVQAAAEALTVACRRGVEFAMNRFNGWNRTREAPEEKAEKA
ncbi:MAG: aminoacyl-tRNA hydrolase [Kiritimatiellaeota bacterium]|nr:aminoacyl-tRNA hydrolase [Kiritimatiellota bacterium]